MTDNTKGTATGTSEKTALGVLSIYIQRGVRWLVERIADHPAVAKSLADMDDKTAEFAYEIIPGLAGFGISKIRDESFKTPERAAMFREICNEFLKKSLDELRKANDPGYELKDPEAVAAEAKKKVEETKLVMDKTGHFHLEDCLELKRVFKKNETYPVTWKDVVDQGKPAADCCFKRASTAFEKQKTDAAPKRPNKKSLSAADVIGMASPEEQKKLNGWLASLTPAEAAQAREFLTELDDEYELKFLLAIETNRLEWLSLLKEKSSKQLLSTFGRFISEGSRSGCKAVMAFGTGVIAGVNNVMDGAKKLDDSLAPLATRLKTEADRPMDTRGPLARLFRRGN